MNTEQAETLKDMVEDSIADAVNSIQEATQHAATLARLLSSDAEYKSEYDQASKWMLAMASNPLTDLLAEISGDGPDEFDDDSPVTLYIDVGRARWLKRMVEFVKTVDSADFQADACDDVIQTITHALPVKQD